MLTNLCVLILKKIGSSVAFNQPCSQYLIDENLSISQNSLSFSWKFIEFFWELHEFIPIFSNFLPLPEFKPSLEEKQENLLNYRPKNPVYLQEIIKFDFF